MRRPHSKHEEGVTEQPSPGARRVLAVGAWLLAAVLATSATAEDKSGVAPNRLKLPKGPGSLEGVGENVEADVNMGLMHYTVRIALPAGYEGMTPGLDLSYSSGTGGSLVGLGWSLPLPAIERMTARGLPRYDAHDALAADGGEELVRLPDGRTYRTRYEKGFVRYTGHDPAGTGRAGRWVAEYPDGRVGYFGAAADGATEENALVRGPQGVFRCQPRRAYQGWVGRGEECEEQPPVGTLFDETGRDATGRAPSITLPDAAERGGAASRKLTSYKPLATVVADEEDGDPASPHQGTPTTVRQDGLGRTVAFERLLDAAGPPIVPELTYDELGNLRGWVDDQGNEKVQEYDLLGRVVHVLDPDAGETRLVYDPAGNLVEQVDARGVAVQQEYDEAGRLLGRWDEAAPAASRISQLYDRRAGCAAEACASLAGRLARVSWPLEPGAGGVGARAEGVDEYGYDARGPLVSLARTLDGHRFELATELDDAGRTIGRRFPGGRTVRYVLDGAGRNAAVPGFVTGVGYTDQGLPAGLELANGTATSYTYDARLRLAGLRTEGPGGEVLQAYSYDRDRAGNLLAVEDGTTLGEDEPSAAAGYDVDALYRLTAARLDAGRQPHAERLDFAYDTLGNLLEKSSDRGAASPDHVGALTYGGPGAGPHAVTRAGALSLQYDPAGNVVLRGPDTYGWDFLGRLVLARHGEQELGRYAYDAAGARVKKVEQGRTTLYLAADCEVRDGNAGRLRDAGAQPGGGDRG